MPPKKPTLDPAIYAAHRTQALATRIPNLAPEALHAIVMDWPIANGITTVLAAADGTASIYLSNGGALASEGAFTDGSEVIPAIRTAALHAIRLATHDHGDARATTETPPPTSPNVVYFYFIYNSGTLLTRANEAKLRDNTDHLHRLGTAMQKIITEYRHWYEQRSKKQ